MATKEHTVNDTNWGQFKQMAMNTWHQLTDEDFNEIKGNLETLGTRLQEVYGLTKERAVFEIEGVVKKFTQSVLGATEAANEKLMRASEVLKPSKPSDSSIQQSTSQTQNKKTTTTANMVGHLVDPLSGSSQPSQSEVLTQSKQHAESSHSDAPIFLKPNGGSMKKKVIKQNVNADVHTTGPKHPEVRHH